MTEHLAARLTVLEALVAAQRRMLRARTPADVTAALEELVGRVGGATRLANGAGPNALPVDLTFGLAEAVVPVAPPGSVPEATLRSVLPELVEDARHVVSLLTDVQRDRESIDPMTSLLTRDRFAAVLEHAGDDDRLVGLSLGDEQRAVATVGRLAYESALRRLGDIVRREAHAADRLGRIGPALVAVLLFHADEDAATSLRRRIVKAWVRPPRPPLDLWTSALAATPSNDALDRLTETLRERDADPSAESRESVASDLGHDPG